MGPWWYKALGLSHLSGDLSPFAFLIHRKSLQVEFFSAEDEIILDEFNGFWVGC